MALLVLPSGRALEAQDPEGDTMLEPGGVRPAPPSGADVRGLAVVEDETGFTFRLDAGDLDNPNEGPFEMTTYRIHATFNDAAYQLVWVRSVTFEPALQPSLRASWRTAADEVLKTLEWDTPFTVTVPRGLITDSTGNLPALGSSLTGIYVESVSDPRNVIPQGTTTVRVTDRLPDEGALDLPSQFGPVTQGAMRAAARQAFRSSNGGADSFVYLVEVTGGGTGARIEAESVPMGWRLYLPERGFAAGVATVPALLETAFGHQHASIGVARLRVTDDAGNVARTDIGINYLDPPRPDGHHATLYFHAWRYTKDAVNDAGTAATGLSFNRESWFNTLADDPADEGVPGIGFKRSGIAGYNWRATLRPALQGGLELLNGTGQIEVALRFPEAARGSLTGNLTWSNSTDSLVLATIVPEGITDFPAGQATVARGTVVAQARRLDVPDGGGELLLQFNVDTANMALPAGPDTQPVWEPGGFMRLPLANYHPAVEDDLAALTGLRLRAPTDVTLAPGGVGEVSPTLEPSMPHRLDVLGGLAAWASVDGDRVRLAAPADARVGDSGEVVLRATALDDPLAWAIARVRVVVGEASDLASPDAESNDAPAAPWVVVVALALGLAARRRLQRGGHS